MINLEEIERALLRDRSIWECAAYCESWYRPPVIRVEIRKPMRCITGKEYYEALLKQILPPSMYISYIVFVPDFPHTGDGKIIRKTAGQRFDDFRSAWISGAFKNTEDKNDQDIGQRKTV